MPLSKKNVINQGKQLERDPVLTSASERGDGLRESRRRPRGETLLGVADLSFWSRASGLSPLEGTAFSGDGLLLGLGLLRTGDALS